MVRVSTEKPIANLINGEKRHAFSLRPETRQVYSLPLLLLNITLQVIANAMRPKKKKDKKGIQIGKR